MTLSDKELIEKYKIKSSEKILDVGGSMKQHNIIQIDTLVDILKPEEAPYGKSMLLAKKFVRVDVTKDNLPFKDKEFDFCLCTHTLEDLYNPFILIDEMSRVARRGYISTPLMGKDMEFSHYNLTDWRTGARRVPGIAHHKWLFYDQNGVMQIIPKNYPLLYSSQFNVKKWLGDDEFQFYWEDKISYKEINDLDIREIIKIYSKYIQKNLKLLKKGTSLIYIDNPLYYLKEIVKLILKR